MNQIFNVDQSYVLSKTSNYEVLGDRQATDLELNNRNKKNSGLFTAILLATTIGLFVVYWHRAETSILILMGISCLVTSFCYWHKPQSNRADVIHIKARIKNKNSLKHQITIGEDLIVNYPPHWQSFIPEKTLDSEEMDVTLSDRRLLCYGNLSISSDIEQFGDPKYIIRNLILFIVGLVSSIIIFQLSNIVYSDLFSYYPFNNKVNVWYFDDAVTLKNSAIQKGDLININMSGASYKANYNDYLDESDIVYINNRPVNEAELVKVDLMMIKKLFDNNLIKTKRDDAVIQQETQLKNEIKEKIKHDRRFQKDYDYVDHSLIKLLNINELISVVDESCKLFEKDQPYYLKKFLMETLLPSGKRIDKWEDMVKYSQQHPDYEEIVNAYRVENIVNLINSLQESVLNYYIDQLNMELENYQFSQQSVSLALANNKKITIIEPDTDNNIVGMMIINRYYNALKGIGGKINIAGLVDDIVYEDNKSVSKLIINDDPLFNKNNANLVSLASPVLISVLLFVITTLIAFSNGVILCWKLIANFHRKNRITTAYANQ